MPTRPQVPRFLAIVLVNRIDGASLPRRRPRIDVGYSLDRAINATAPGHALVATLPGGCHTPERQWAEAA